MRWRVIVAVLFACLLPSIWGDWAQGAGGGSGVASPVGSGTAAPAPSAVAVDEEEEEEEDKQGDWEFEPYVFGWVPINVGLEASDGEASADVNLGTDTLIKSLRWFEEVGVEVRYKQRWFAAFETISAGLNVHGEEGTSQDFIGPLNVTTGPIKITVPNLTAIVGPLDYDVDIDVLIWRGLLGYRLLSKPMSDFSGGGGPKDERRLDLDVYLGGRYWYWRVVADIDGPPIQFPGTTGTVSIPGRPNTGQGAFSIPATSTGPVNYRSKTKAWWIDPIFGGRVKADITDRVYLRLGGNVGGFDWGSASKFTWEAMSNVGLRFKDRWSVELGYRALHFERVKGDLEIDLLAHGPIMYLSYRF